MKVPAAGMQKQGHSFKELKKRGTRKQKSKWSEDQGSERHGERIEENRNNYSKQKVIDRTSRRVQRMSQVVKGRNYNKNTGMSIGQYRR